jgi:hypothetical protein
VLLFVFFVLKIWGLTGYTALKIFFYFIVNIFLMLLVASIIFSVWSLLAFPLLSTPQQQQHKCSLVISVFSGPEAP